jgi:hypothetical protein
MRLFATAALTSLLVCPSFAQSPAPVSPETRNAIRQLVGDIMVNGKAYDYDRQLADNTGPRLTGSDNYVHAPHDTPAQVEQMLKEAKQYENYQFFKNARVFP